MASKCCPTYDDLLAYTLGRVSLGSQAALTEHLRDCEACLAVLAEMESEMDPLLSAVTRASLQPRSAELLGDQAVYNHGLTQTMALVGTACLATEGCNVLEETPHDRRLGQYELLEELGRGGMGIVYRARHHRLERIVALKVLHRSRLANVETVELFQQEMKAVGKLDHPNIVQATDAGQVDGVHFLAMEFVAGENLSRLVSEGQRFAARRSVELICEVARGLQHAHQRGLVHRDVKPSNILLDNQGRARITDFGLVLRENDLSDDLAYAGTPAYMSPEQARGEGHRVDGRSDVFSLGGVFYLLLTGRRPFSGRGFRPLCEQIVSAEPIPPRMIDASLPQELERICLKALAKDLSERYATAGELADDLDAWLNGLDRDGRTHDADSLEIVPKGTQCYDADDRRFFLELVPGPRDRSGLPESIRFWKRSIERTGIERSFRIAVLRGSNGCGKTSFLRAGLLPKLAGHVTPIHVVATGKHTETALAARLYANFPSLSENLQLAEALTEVKHPLAEQPDAKILIVLDQFEQWLHTNHGRERTALADALQLCDGQRIQCLLVVRDELWESMTRFMKSSGILLEDGVNCGTIELLDRGHARSVLAAHGRAYGALPNRLRDQATEHIRFLDAAINDLAEDGSVNPFRLAIFAETIKNVLWTPARLRRMGGVRGVGVAFLNTTFSASSSHRKYRHHRHAARAILAEICPDPGKSLHDSPSDYSRLLHVSGYAEVPQKFEELLSILNHRIKLISLVDPQALTGDETARKSEADCRGYRLSHDYLVPIVREWLTTNTTDTPPHSTRQRAIWLGVVLAIVGVGAALLLTGLFP